MIRANSETGDFVAIFEINNPPSLHFFAGLLMLDPVILVSNPGIVYIQPFCFGNIKEKSTMHCILAPFVFNILKFGV